MQSTSSSAGSVLTMARILLVHGPTASRGRAQHLGSVAWHDAAVACPAMRAEISSSVGKQCLLWSPQQPQPEDIIAAVNEAAQAAAAKKPKTGLGALLQQLQQQQQPPRKDEQ